jgi:hypothetical protein
MKNSGPSSEVTARSDSVIVAAEANSAGKLRGDFEAMARRRFQNPKPFKEGQFWWLRVWDTGPTGSRKRQRIKLAQVEMPAQEVKKIAEDKLRPLNQGLELTGSAMTLADYMTGTYIPTYLPLLSSSTQDSYSGVISKYLEPRFGDMCLRDLTRQTLQQYFSGMAVKVAVSDNFEDQRRSVFDSSFRGRCWLPEQESDGRCQAAT